MNIPRELQIKPPSGELEKLLLLAPEASGKAESQAPTAKSSDTAALDKANEVLSGMARSLAAIATSAWKMQSRLIDPETDAPRETFDTSDAKKLARDVRTLLSTLTDMGITIRDRTGQVFDYGMPEKVIDAKPQPGITRERVVETLRPTITWTTAAWKDTIIQQGEVLIQTPQQ